ncbi:DUF6817 domain-containing protein [Rhabdothermincola salaria]|uniref:DUF6817 domain-containing protein n=1 Tax=Rhabdothermincola salaria TaxID=2903142 RepID=UPI001E3FCA48|nr:hypothetical protein [Rhabdothermincola salaria]MCD9622331.1 hypothetical protein [Rhabdothermincola salaria]
MADIAQTWPQMVCQLGEADFDPSQLAVIRAAFDRASLLFAGAERPEGKPFLDHLIGTASGTLIAGAPADTVAAALVHAAYDQGDFGDSRRGADHRHRRDLRHTVGARAEAIVHRYHTLGWSPEIARRCRTELAVLTWLDRQAIVVRVANEVDDSLHGALRISGKLSHPTHDRGTHDELMSLAEALTTPAFVAVARETLVGDPPPPPPELVVGRGRSRVQLPASARWRTRRVAEDTARHLRRRVHGLAGRARRRLPRPRPR